MKKTMDSGALIPVIKIDQSIVPRMTKASKTKVRNVMTYGLLMGTPDFSGERPIINFNKFDIHFFLFFIVIDEDKFS